MSSATLRQELAQAAARIICEQGVKDYAVAKTRAAEQLGQQRGPLPRNSEVAESVMEYLRVFQNEEWLQRLRVLRETAIQAMQLTDCFDPRAVGAVVSGLATLRSTVSVHLYCPFDEALDFFLGDRNIPFDGDEVRLKHPAGHELRKPTCVFMAQDVEVQLVVFAEDERRWSPLSPIDGKPMQRWGLD
ncbi:MAG: hypothetical protein ACSHXK_07815, partial [Oceanococcus sp.]